MPLSESEMLVANNDIISNLPVNMIEKIMECMSLKDAVRTSILSSNWRYNWVTLSQLVFDEEFGTYVDGSPQQNYRIRNIINQVLLHHVGPIHKFVLDIPNFREDIEDLERWTLDLLSNGVKELSLSNHRMHVRMLPPHLFSCLELTHLQLCNYTLKPPPAFKGFPYLIDLNLYEIKFKPQTIERLISGSPLLESLIFDHCFGAVDFNIRAPNLKYFRILGGLNSMSPIKSSYMTELCLFLMKLNNPVVWKTPSLEEIINYLPKLEKLYLGSDTLEILAAGVPKVLLKKVNHLKFLQFGAVNFTKLDQFSSFFALIRSSPALKKLVSVRTSFEDAATEAILKFLAAQSYRHCILGQLREVEIHDFRGLSVEVELIKYILARSPILESMVIRRNRSGVYVVADARLRIAIMQFPRASPKAAVKYLNPLGDPVPLY